MPLNPGEKLGPYEILSPIGAGGMGEVYKARDTRLDRTVAVKVLPEHIAQREDLRARFEREARAVASLNHPNICSLFDIGPGYMVMEMVEGETLAARIEKGPLSLEQALKFATQIADALDRAHRAGVTHRDVKPQNIMVTRDGVKILDFGLAKSTSSKPAPTEATLTAVLTAEGTVLGTPQYMAPELFEGREADARADIWAFGAVLHEMVTGRKAFEGKSYSSLVGAVLSADPAPITPSWLDRLVRRCLAKDPDERYQSMRDVVLDLRTPPLEAPSQASRWPWPVAAAGAAAALFLGFAAGWLGMPKSTPATQDSPVRLSIVPPGNGSVTAFTISPDGRRIAFPVAKDGKSQLWVRRLDSDVAVAVPGTEGAGANEAAAWSPDGEQLAFVSNEMLKLVTVQSGRVKELTRARNRGITWNTDDVILFVDFDQQIHRVSAAGGPPEKVKLDLGGAAGARFPQFLPDQNRFLYVTREGAIAAENSSIRVGSLDGKTDKTVLAQQITGAEFVAESGGTLGWLLYVRGGSLLAHRMNLTSLELEGKPVELSEAVGSASGGSGRSFFSAHSRLVAYRASESAAVQLVWFNPSGKRLQNVGEPQARFGQIRLSPDGRQALADRRLPQYGGSYVEAIDLVSGTATRRTFDSRAIDPVWSPDGRTIFFTSRKEDRIAVFESPPDWSAPPAPVGDLAEFVHAWDYHPAHQTLLLYTVDSQARALKRSSSGWEPVKFPNPGEPFAKGKFSPDGRWVAYQTGSAAAGVYAMPYPPTGAKWQVAPDGLEPVWRRDGKEIYYIRGADEIMAVSVDGSDRAPKFGTPRSLFRVTLPPPTIPGHRFDVGPDGRLLVMERLAEPPGVPFSVLLNWRSLLEKQ